MCRGRSLKPAIHNLLQWRSVKMERKVSRKKRVKSKEVDFKKLFRVSEGPAFVNQWNVWPNISVCVCIHTPECVELRLQWQNTVGHGASLHQHVCEPHPLLHILAEQSDSAIGTNYNWCTFYMCRQLQYDVYQCVQISDISAMKYGRLVHIVGCCDCSTPQRHVSLSERVILRQRRRGTT